MSYRDTNSQNYSDTRRRDNLGIVDACSRRETELNVKAAVALQTPYKSLYQTYLSRASDVQTIKAMLYRPQLFYASSDANTCFSSSVGLQKKNSKQPLHASLDPSPALMSGASVP